MGWKIPDCHRLKYDHENATLDSSRWGRRGDAASIISESVETKMTAALNSGVLTATILADGSVRTPLTQAQFDAAELQVRREISARSGSTNPSAFDPEELRLLDFFIERSFQLGRTAAYFPSYRRLCKATETTT